MKIPLIVHILLLNLVTLAPALANTRTSAIPDSSSNRINDSINIESCYAAAERNYPLVKQYGLIEKTTLFTVENAAKNRLPQLQLNAQAQVQSDVTELPFDLSKLGLNGVDNPKLNADRYDVNMVLNQLIYDGNNIKTQQQAVAAQAEVEKQQVRVTLYSLREKVNNLFFGILLTEKQLHINEVMKNTLHLHAEKVEKLIRGGLAQESDLDAIKVEQLKTEQTTVNYRATRMAYVRMLALLTGLPLTAETLFITPLPAHREKPATTGEHRPETALFARQLEQIGVQRKQLDTQLRPRLSLFAQGGYGRPGLNMLSNNFDFYGIAGLNLTWNFSPLYTRKNDLKLLDMRSRQVKVAQEVFNYNLNIETAQHETETVRCLRIMKHDEEIIRLRERIRTASEKKLTGGTATTTDLMQDLNNEQQARLEHALHEVQYLLAGYNLLYCTGEAAR